MARLNGCFSSSLCLFESAIPHIYLAHDPKYNLEPKEIEALERELIDTSEVIQLFDKHFRSCSKSTFYEVYRHQIELIPYGSRARGGQGRAAHLYDKGQVLRAIFRVS